MLNQRRSFTWKQRWFWVDSNDQFCSYIRFEKLKSLYHCLYIIARVSTSKKRQFLNVKSTLEFGVENNVNFELTLKNNFVLIS